MRSEITTPPPVQPTASTTARPASVDSAQLLQLLQALPENIAEGQKLQAQVISAKQAGQVFEALLKMSLPDGKQATVPAQVNQILMSGQQVTLTAINQAQFILGNAIEKALPALTRLDPTQFPAGSIVQARVVSLEPQTQGNFRATLSLLNTAQAGQTLVVDTPRALALDSTLTARVQGAGSLQIIPQGQNADHPSIQHALLNQFSRQGSLGHALQQLQAASGNLPAETRKLVQQLLNNLPNISQKPDSTLLAELVKNSGIQLEQRLLGDAAGAAQQDLKAVLLRLIGQVAAQSGTAVTLLNSTQAAMMGHALPQLLREIGGINLSQMREQAQRFPLAKGVLQRLDNPNDLGTLLRIAAAALSRLQTHQLSSLGQTYTTAEGSQVTTWQLEIPMRAQDQLVELQLKFQQEQEQAEQEQEQKDPVWRLELSFELDPLGPLHVQVNLKNEQLSSKLWAERAGTAKLVNQELHVLRDKLLAAGLNILSLECQQGTPPAAPKAAIEQRWIDDLA